MILELINKLESNKAFKDGVKTFTSANFRSNIKDKIKKLEYNILYRKAIRSVDFNWKKSDVRWYGFFYLHKGLKKGLRLVEYVKKQDEYELNTTILSSINRV